MNEKLLTQKWKEVTMKGRRASGNTIRSDFDRIAAHEEPGRWDHNNHYHPLMLRELPARRGSALDLSCGRGELLALLADRFDRATGLDCSAGMLRAARESLRGLGNVRLIRADAAVYAYRPASLDFIVSVAAFHHLPLAKLLPRLQNALRPGGRLAVLDLYRSHTPLDFFLAALAVPANLVYEFWRNRGRPQSGALRAAWRAHGAHERPPRLAEIRRIAGRLLPGAKVRRLFFWRYLLVWEKIETKEPINYRPGPRARPGASARSRPRSRVSTRSRSRSRRH